MFSNTAYEALYQYLGLSLQERLRDIIVSEGFFKMVILIIFGSLFLITCAKYFTRHISPTLIPRYNVSLSKIVVVIGTLFLGLSILRVDSTSTSLWNYRGDSWHTNRYIKENISDVKPSYRVNFVFDIVSRSAEQISNLFARTVDGLFKQTHSQLEAPSFFYKAIMEAGSSTISDPVLKNQINFYVDECFDKFLPMIGSKKSMDKLDGFFFRSSDHVDTTLSKINITTQNASRQVESYTCLDLKTQVRNNLNTYANAMNGGVTDYIDTYMGGSSLNSTIYRNQRVSKLLTNYFLDQHENLLGIKKGSQVGGSVGKIVQYINQIPTVDTFLSVIGFRKLHGAALHAERSKEFNILLSRAPHIAGFIKLILIACFPLLVFIIVAGKWKWLAYWFAVYLSVLLWNPIWTLFYHIVTNIGVASGLMSEFGKLYDGISLYSAEIVESRIYYMYAVYSWIQLLAGLFLLASSSIS